MEHNNLIRLLTGRIMMVTEVQLIYGASGALCWKCVLVRSHTLI